jgi:hypothetical protein
VVSRGERRFFERIDPELLEGAMDCARPRVAAIAENVAILHKNRCDGFTISLFFSVGSSHSLSELHAVCCDSCCLRFP